MQNKTNKTQVSKVTSYYTIKKREWRAKNKKRARDYNAQYYQKHKDEKKAYNKTYYKSYREANKDLLNAKAKQKAIARITELKEFLGGKCRYCGSSEHLHFHHIDNSTKEFNIGNSLNFRYDRLLNEAKKCILLCDACHRALHKIIGKKRRKK